MPLATTILFLAIPFEFMTTFSLCGYGFLIYFVPRLATSLMKEERERIANWMTVVLNFGEKLYIIFIIMVVALLFVGVFVDEIHRVITYLYFSINIILGALYCVMTSVLQRNE